MSFFIISDGKNYKSFGTAQDHKRAMKKDKGKILVEWELTHHQDLKVKL